MDKKTTTKLSLSTKDFMYILFENSGKYNTYMLKVLYTKYRT